MNLAPPVTHVKDSVYSGTCRLMRVRSVRAQSHFVSMIRCTLPSAEGASG